MNPYSDFYLRPPDWRQERAYREEIQAEEEIHQERKELEADEE